MMSRLDAGGKVGGMAVSADSFDEAGCLGKGGPCSLQNKIS